jgi:phosphoglycerate dehydrogenase-like enzyme
MIHHVVCLRPEADFARVDALPPSSLAVSYHAPDDPKIVALIKAAGALVIPAVGPKLPKELFRNTTLRLVQVTGTGVDRLDRTALVELGIPVANVAGGSNGAVAEYSVAAASLLLRGLGWADAEIKAGNYGKFRARMMADNLAGLEGLLVGVVGFGMIGRAVAQAFHRMGCRIGYFDPAASDRSTADAIGARAMTFDELLAEADIVTLHVPLLPDTQNLIGEEQFAKMKSTAVLIQGSRGGIVNEAALAKCLVAGRIHGAAVDVYSTEPPGADNPLLSLKGEAAHRLLLTPHVAGVTRQSAALLFCASWDNVVRVLVRGKTPINRVY